MLPLELQQCRPKIRIIWEARRTDQSTFSTFTSTSTYGNFLLAGCRWEENGKGRLAAESTTLKLVPFVVATEHFGRGDLLRTLHLRSLILPLPAIRATLALGRRRSENRWEHFLSGATRTQRTNLPSQCRCSGRADAEAAPGSLASGDRAEWCSAIVDRQVAWPSPSSR